MSLGASEKIDRVVEIFGREGSGGTGKPPRSRVEKHSDDVVATVGQASEGLVDTARVVEARVEGAVGAPGKTDQIHPARDEALTGKSVKELPRSIDNAHANPVLGRRSGICRDRRGRHYGRRRNTRYGLGYTTDS